ncbi:MAG: hypothetical protein ABIS36_26240 [Chryseolinea sp.]
MPEFTTRQELAILYSRRKEQFSSLLSAETRKINIVSNFRLLTALILIVLVYLAFRDITWIYVALVDLLIFVILVYKHAKLFRTKTHLENLIKVNVWEHAAMSGDISSFSPGTEFMDQHHSYTHDLDIFGPGSLFQSVNRCNTFFGRAAFARLLSTPLSTKEEIVQNQEAVKELSVKLDFRQDFQAAGSEINELPGDRQELLDWLKLPSIIYGNKWLALAIWLLPAITISALIAVIFFPVPNLVLIIPVVTQWIHASTYSKRISVFHDYISRKKGILEKYAQILKFIQPEQFQSSRMKALKAKAAEADVRVQKLAGLVNALNARLNSIMWLVVNSFFMYDIRCVYRLEEWKTDNSTKLKYWLDAISETEVLCSLGTFGFNNSSFVFPEIHEKVSIEASGMGHPLVPVEKCITNDVSIGNKASVFIITGANMAGKSTFLRTIGVNFVLAKTGAPVFAKEFKCPVIPLRSGMRTADSLKDNESYFYAELHRLKAIMDELRSGKPLFILLDEILKGTNSGDKQRGSIALVRQLLEHPCLTLVATHDLALGDLENEFPDKVKNYRFEANIENDQLSFDYKLNPGVAQKMNATFLMKKMGIIP